MTAATVAAAVIAPQSFGQLASTLAANGYPPLPLHPGKKNPIPSGWQNYVFAEGDEKKFAAAGTGILTGKIVAVDIDILDQGLANRISEIVERRLGLSPIRIGQWPKRLATYRTDTPFSKKSTRPYRLPNDAPDAKGHRVEILAEGQQFVAFGVHPGTGKPYAWNGAGDPLTVPVEKLSPVSEAQCDALIAELEVLLGEHGAPAGKLRAGDGQREHTPNENLRGDPEKVRAALAVIPNDDLAYEDWRDVGMALKGALGDEGYDAWGTFSAKSKKYDAVKTAKTWKGFKPERIGAGTIFHLAQEARMGLSGIQLPAHLSTPEAIAAAASINARFAIPRWDHSPTKGEPAPTQFVGNVPSAPATIPSAPIVPSAPSVIIAPSPSQNAAAILNEIILPNDNFTFSQSAQTIFPRLAATNRYFSRGGEVVALADTSLGLALEPVSADAFRSLIDRLGCPVRSYIKTDAGRVALQAKRCSKDNAVALLASEEARTLLPTIRLVSQSPVLVVRDGKPTVLAPGYNLDLGGTLILGREALPQVTLADAVASLRQLIADYDFESLGDESRALAAMITPALRMGGLLLDSPTAVARYPISIIEANKPQTGKGHFQQLTCAIYRERAYVIAKRNGGVGSLDESIGHALLSGRPFVSIDNVRGHIDSQYLEMLLTCDGSAPVRVAHRGEVLVDIRAVQFQMTSNGVDITSDLAKRSSIVRLRKRPDDYQFREWPDGRDILSHVETYSGYYLACVLAVVSHWLAAGRPKSHGGGFHDFREWAGALGWIVENVFGAAPLLEGHKDAQERTSNPALTWLRLVCIAAERTKQLDQELSASAIVELCDNEGVELPGLQPAAEEGAAPKHVGKLFAKCFPEKSGPSAVSLDSYQLLRTEREERNLERQLKTVKRYRIVGPVGPGGI
jgi:hypothetical protein